MSSSQRRRRPGARRLARWSLRARLIVAVTALLAVICVIVGVVTELELRDFLIRQKDNQLISANHRANDGDPHPPGPDQGQTQNPGPDYLNRPGQAPDTFGASIENGAVARAGRVANGVVVAAPSSVYPTLLALPTDGRPYTRTLGDLGDYRLVATRTDTGAVLITGLPLADVDATVLRLALVEASVALAGLILVGLAGTVVVRRTLRPLERVAATARQVSELPLDRGEVVLSVRVPSTDTDPRTEVGQVSAALNRMLGHVARALAARQASETRMRRFLADASHELRTPLAAIRGYAELARRVQAQVPEDVAHALRRVESESDRMTALVEDLLLLARLDSGRPLEREPVDVTRLALDATSDAHVAGPGHRWVLDLPEEPVSVVGDGARLHQVLANLLANARVHTPAGTTVTVGVRQDGDAAVVLTVSDNGPGIPPELLPTVFDRFARADTSRSRAAGSTGLGLSIVAAVAHAHGGDVTVDSVPGRTVFTVTLPCHPEPALAG